MIKKTTEAKDRIILALDTDDIDEAKQLVIELKDYVGYFKIGLQLIVSHGFEAYKMLEELGAKFYYDAKFHDIPNTVQKACISLVKNDIDFFNVHIQGGSKMTASVVKASKAAAKSLGIEPPTILGVTLLSSFGQKTLTTELCVDRNIQDYVLELAKVAKETGLDGVVASADEAKKIRQYLKNEESSEDFIILCPATRPTWASVNDQVRVDTPRDAILAGADFMVIGRPITTAEDRVVAAKLIIDEIEMALEDKENELFV
ncbi:MAG: orotidine-5'-phosphate decarboxylase [Candidatus Gastranaerophilales bacterium]